MTTSLIAPLVIGKHTFANNIIQGPLAGVSCAPFRALTSIYGQPAFTYTEMISCKTLLHAPKSTHHRFVWKDPEEGPVCFQLSSADPHELGEAVKVAEGYGADLIDLNCGCPVKKIRQKGAGSRLLADAQQLFYLMSAMRKNTALPISIKIRVDGASNEKFNDEIIRAVNDSGVDFLTVHGRHWSEHYETACRHDEIAYFVQHTKIPVIGNGDISCKSSLEQMLRTNCAGAMIARSGVGQPWLTKQLIAQMNGDIFTPPSPKETGMIFLDHIARLTDLLKCEKFAIIQARKFAKYYARGLENRLAFQQAINHCDTFLMLKTLIEHHFL